ncbi:RecQ-mediated genome instability protein 2 homolog [Caenorhabditis elegans]|uniref:RecQ-mediated genome instability protein 2 homolog n=1 Tax=Caenorhabditis elegans TaxID=6239 RepID=RMI2_CAEEL|nr:RecQ-mediated genome instability protein 2 homolog [Caenorhabditis elegans]Q8MXU4.1 RecName: Full=RecQ-mediated genome instability protein 2 homolog; AltName: Full=RMI2 functional homolog 2 [Caenorhabditis elegans]CCD67731.1 RecQ-mediated genome instability protein 2 homolog [Caenorhabditis elegans]|eukprot:NP_741302.1 Uncharacterized protein CELE_Y104H12D.4 [Caenorhabditis elegans]
MCDRDDCASIASRCTGETIICAFVESITPPKIRDKTGTYELKCPFAEGFTMEIGDLFLFHFVFDGSSEKCTRLTPIPKMLAMVYEKLLKDLRKAKKEGKMIISPTAN